MKAQCHWPTFGVARDRMRRIVVQGGRLSAAVCICLALSGAASAEVVRIEEDWRVEITAPEPLDHAPQIVNVISPLSSLDWTHAVFEINHATLPEYYEGGMQLQRWFGEYVLDYRNAPGTDLLNTDNETITYTIRMKVGEGKLQFEVVDGNSETWGTFGGEGYLKHSEDTIITDLDNYNPATSVGNSRIGFASHRVKKFVRTQVRYYDADNALVATDETEHVVHQHLAESGS